MHVCFCTYDVHPVSFSKLLEQLLKLISGVKQLNFKKRSENRQNKKVHSKTNTFNRRTSFTIPVIMSN